MANRHELEISIDPSGKVIIEVKGVNGKSCLDITKDIEEELGVLLGQERKPEFYKNEDQINLDVKS